MAISTVLTGLVVSRFKPGLKKVILIGCIIMNTSVAVTYFTVKQSFILTLFTYSFTAGIGFGVCYLTPLEIAMKWFPNSKGSANSAILFGYGIGGIIFNQIQTQFINPNNYSPDKSYRYIFCYLIYAIIFFIYFINIYIAQIIQMKNIFLKNI